MRMSRSRFMVPATLTLAAGFTAALAGCSSSQNSAPAYGSEGGFGAGDRFGSYLFVNPPKPANAAKAQPANAKAANAKANPAARPDKAKPAKANPSNVTTANVAEQNAD